jgi:hypothetical protein
MSNDAHTATPWTLTHIEGTNFAIQEFDIRGMFGDSPNVYPIFQKDRSAIDGTYVCLHPADAAFIVKAVNSHDTLTALLGEMKTALEWCSRHLKKIEEEQYPGIDEGLRRFNSRANADVVIQKAKEAGL